MSFLLKNSLLGIKKNLPIVSVLGFFVALGTTVLSSVDHLTDNLNKGFQEINFDSNPHDLVLVSKGFKPSQNLNIEPFFATNTDKLPMTVSSGHRWSFDSTEDFGWKQDKTKTKTLLKIPSEGPQYINRFIYCVSDKSFIPMPNMVLVFDDRNRASLNPNATDGWKTLSEDLSEVSITAKCPNSATMRSYRFFGAFFLGLLKFKHQAQDEDLLHTIHKETLAFNKKTLFKSSDTGEEVYRPFYEEDFFLKFDIPFKNFLAGHDISKKYHQLIDRIGNSTHYQKFNEATRNSMNLFKDSEFFSDIKSKYYISSLSNTLSTFNARIPSIPGITYSEMVISLFKLVLWPLLSKTSETQFNLKDLQNLQNTVIFQLNSISNTSTTSPAPKTNLGDYIFQTLPEKKTFNDIKSQSQFWKNQTTPPTGSTVREMWKNVMQKWVNKDNKDNKDIKSFERNTESITDSNQINNEYGKPPEDFEKVYKKIADHIKQSVDSYLLFLSIQNLKKIRKFISDNEIFTLSFLLYDFQYSHQNINIQDDQKIRLTASNIKTLDFVPSVNYHRSLVVANDANVSSKLNDPSKSHHSFKIITQEAKDDSSLNRLKILSGNPLIESKVDHISVISKLLWPYRDKFKDQNPSAYSFKDVFKLLSRSKFDDEDINQLFEKTYKYYSSPYPDTWTDGLWYSKLDTELMMRYADQIDSYSRNIKTQGSRLIFELINQKEISPTRTAKLNRITDTVSTYGYIDQFTSYFALISPFYAQKNNIKPISDQQYEKFKKLINNLDLTQADWETEYAAFVLDPVNQDHILNINGNKLIIVGTALTPDMMLPSHSWLSLVPNTAKEALVFVDQYAFKNLQYKSLSSWDEFYLSLAYPQAIKDHHLEQDYKLKLSQYIEDFLSKDSEFALNTVSDPSSRDLVFLRSNYVNSFLGAINILSSTLLIFVGLVIFFTVWVLIKRYISSALNTFGVFVANGVQRGKISITALSFVILPGLLGGVIGYMASLVLQPSIFALFTDVWYLSPIFAGFNLSNLLYYLLIVVSVLSPISFFSSSYMMRNNVGNLMKINVAFKQNKLTKLLYEFLGQNVSALWKFRLSVILNTLSRGLILSLATVFLFVFSSFLFNNLGQFAYVSSKEVEAKDYGFNLSFHTPTTQSGQYLLTSYSNLGDTFLDKTPHTKRVVLNEKGKYSAKEISFDKDNPELISSGIYTPYYPDDIDDFFVENKDQDLSWWNKNFKTFNADYPARSFVKNPYNLYMFKSKLSKSQQQEGGLYKKYTRSTFKLPTPTIEKAKLFNSSATSATKGFNPDLSDDNAKELLDLSNYVPVKNEKVKNGSGDQTANEMLTFNGEPLFKPLIDYYKKKDPILGSQDGEFKKWDFWENSDSDFRELNQNQNHKHPTLGRLFRDHSNYWLFSYDDLEQINKDPTFFKNRVILPILFNHNWTFNLFGKIISVNPWLEFTDFLSKYSSELIAAIDNNYSNFVNEIIHSRYSEYFVTRFMSKHADATLATNHQPGKAINGKPSWYVDKDKIKEKTGNNSYDVDSGLYWFDSSKIIYLYDKIAFSFATSQLDEDVRHPERFVIFRPDFLYLFYALMKDPDFLKPGVAPIKITFNQNVYIPNYNSPEQEWIATGDLSEDAKLGLVAAGGSGKYDSLPGGDQTYTYLDGDVVGTSIKNVRIFGLKQDPRGSYVKLKNNGKTLNYKLYSGKVDGGYPIIVNKFTAKKLGLEVGSKFSVSVRNFKDRFTKKMEEYTDPAKTKSEVDPRVMATFTVVDIFDSYYNTAFFISQKDANTILGLDDQYGYNGIFTKKFEDSSKLPAQLMGAITGYSPSGIYSKQKISKSSSDFLNFLSTNAVKVPTTKLNNHSFVQPDTHEWFRLRSNLTSKNGALDRPDQLVVAMDKAFGTKFSLTSTLDGLENISLVNDFIFSTVSDLVISIINLFISVFSPLLVCSLLIITTLIIDDLKNLLTILNLLGFTYVENSVTILLYLGLILGFSLFVALPLTSFLLSTYVEGIFGMLNIYLPIYLRFDYAFVSILLLVGMFAFSFWVSMKKIKGLYLPVAMKTLNG